MSKSITLIVAGSSQFTGSIIGLLILIFFLHNSSYQDGGIYDYFRLCIP